ncbi:MAG: hypothetical protein WAV10_00950 [Minisyncoccia bacterium]
MAFASAKRFNERVLTYSELTAKRDKAIIATVIFCVPAMFVVLVGLLVMFEPWLQK